MSKGIVLLIDYGMDRNEYHHPQRKDGTLRCYYKHKASDNPFDNIGKQDITTSVNFSDVAEHAVEVGFELSGYCTQKMFLISLGIENFLFEEEDDAKRNTLAQQIKQLLLPSAMGETFKVLALSKKQTVKLDGFREQNLLRQALKIMDIFQTITLSLIQGLTEFLPISSSAHLALLPKLLNWPDQGWLLMLFFILERCAQLFITIAIVC